MAQPKTKNLITAPECARRLGVHPSTVTRWVRSGSIPAIRIEGIIRLDWRDVLAAASKDSDEASQPGRHTTESKSSPVIGSDS